MMRHAETEAAVADEKNGRPVKISVRNLTKRFGDLLVLDDLTFNIHANEFVCVVGPTGCGKTTFLNCLTRIYEPTSGDLLIDNASADPQKHNISFVFQEPSAFPWLTVEENLAYGLKIKRVAKGEIERRVNQILDLMGLQQFRKSYPGELSVSIEQRVIIGRSFAMRPDLLLMDEPYGQMDVKVRFYLEDEVIRLWKELGSTIVFITHNIEEAVYLAERVIILSNKPACIKEELVLDLPRPRNIAGSEFIQYRKYITDKIKWW
jgi:sulfonate transport system ATP-binding protein